jgi:hypothetical protein
VTSGSRFELKVMGANRVEQAQGWYGAYTLSERVIQKIWLAQDFLATGLSTVSGKSLQVKHPGRWNLLSGPDFKEAQFILDGVELTGDVEVHFSASDWYAHQHHINPAYDAVRLHIILNATAGDTCVARTSNGTVPEEVHLLPVLHRDLETYALDLALCELEQVDGFNWAEPFLVLPSIHQQAILEAHAQRRWQEKLRFAKQRFEALGWAEASHQYCLEVLGYARNRGPMAAVAQRYSLSVLVENQVSIEELFLASPVAWHLDGVRPAQPSVSALAALFGDCGGMPRLAGSNRAALTAHGPYWMAISPLLYFGGVRDYLHSCRNMREQIFMNRIGTRRYNTLMVDALLPLATAAGIIDAEAYWQHWPAGDTPNRVQSLMRRMDFANGRGIRTNGYVQGMLGLSLAKAAKA